MSEICNASHVIHAYRNDIILFCKIELKLTPDKWQEKALRAFADGNHKVMRIAMRAAVGPGKSCVMAVAALWFLLTQGEAGNHPKGAALSITAENLRDGMWAEIAKWKANSQLLTALFEQNSERIYAKHHPKTWFIAARSFAKTATLESMGITLSGLHSKYIAFLIDESGGMAPAIGKSAEQALSTTDIEFGRVLISGNPVDRQSLLGQAVLRESDRWHIITISNDPDDPDRSTRVSKEWAQQQIDTYGRDDPWVQAHVLSIFPDASISTLLSEAEVVDAQRRHYPIEVYGGSEKRIGVDVAGGGMDMNVLFPRQGLVAFNYMSQRHCPSNQLAAKVVGSKIKWGCDHVFFDATGGWGSSAVQSMIEAGHPIHAIEFGGKAPDEKFKNMRSYMWWHMALWIKRGGAIPKCNRLARELTSVMYILKSDGKFLLEPKDAIKKRLGWSPDIADALALTFALQERSGGDSLDIGENNKTRDWNPLKF